MSQIRAGAVIFANDYTRLAEFYEHVVDMTVRETDANHVRLESESFQLVVQQIPSHMSQKLDVSEAPLRREHSRTKLVFFTASIHETREAANVFGGGLNGVDKEWLYNGYKVCDGHDAEGNVFQVREPVG